MGAPNLTRAVHGVETAKLCTSPAERATAVTPLGSTVVTGTLLLVVVPLRNSPYMLSPQASTVPVERNAKLWKKPPAMAVTAGPDGSDTSTGVFLLILVPSPNWPLRLNPQDRSAPVELNARVWSAPVAMEVMTTPAGSDTDT